ncbi:MAG TPA: DNA (cytosine-5-)-methyltransferase [Planctomycetota bacterium]
MNSVELFAGAGGLALGVARAGFKHLLVSEWDKEACDTLRRNAARVPEMAGWPVVEGDVRSLDYRPLRDRVDLLAGGPPCQPFSLGGKHGGEGDARNLFPEAIRAVRELRPKAVLFENVKGLLRSSFRPYLDYIRDWLRRPGLTPKEGESWEAHHARLRESKEVEYDVHSQLVDSANYGVPQSRQRVLMVAFRSDLKASWSTPPATAGEDALFHAQWISKRYWKEVGASVPRPPVEVKERLAREGLPLFPPALERWRTVRDALRGLPKPRTGMDAEIANHVLISGARAYPGHTGSELDLPAKTLKAGDHGVPGGENMLRLGGGRVRYFTVRESARLQTFPDAFTFHSAWGESMRQLGNAVPVTLAEVFATAIRDRLARAGSPRKRDAAAV